MPVALSASIPNTASGMGGAGMCGVARVSKPAALGLAGRLADLEIGDPAGWETCITPRLPRPLTPGPERGHSCPPNRLVEQASSLFVPNRLEACANKLPGFADLGDQCPIRDAWQIPRNRRADALVRSNVTRPATLLRARAPAHRYGSWNLFRTSSLGQECPRSLRPSDFGLRACFGFRFSEFGFPHPRPRTS